MTTAILLAGASASATDPSRPTLKPALSTLRLSFQAIREGLAAARRYERLTARGVPPAEAAAQAFRDGA